MISFNVHFYRFEHVISFSKWKSRSLFPFSAGSKTLKIKRALNRRARWIIHFKKVSELISWVPEVFSSCVAGCFSASAPSREILSRRTELRAAKPRKKGLTETGNRAWKVSATQGTELKHYPLFPDWTEPCPRPRDLEPNNGVTSCEASKKRTNRNRKPRMKSLCHSGYGTQALYYHLFPDWTEP